jgi:hypothetical protein
VGRLRWCWLGDESEWGRKEGDHQGRVSHRRHDENLACGWIDY